MTWVHIKSPLFIYLKTKISIEVNEEPAVLTFDDVHLFLNAHFANKSLGMASANVNMHNLLAR